MKKVILIFSLIVLGTAFVFGQSNDELSGGSDFTSDDELFGGSDISDDSLFGSDDDLFGDDDLFSDDGIEEITDTTAKDDLSKGILFEAGSVKVGGNLRAGINTNSILYSPDADKDDFWENIKNTSLTPNLSAFLTVDARPNENLRMYTKFGMAYPFVVTGNTTLWGTTKYDIPLSNGGKIPAGTKLPAGTNIPEMPINPTAPKVTGLPATSAVTAVKDWFTLKELFTDFSVADTAFFRFGLHTVSWGTGYFFSPVSDMINTSSIDPENPTEQVNGSLNLRTQIIFPDTQNCLWLYMVPSININSNTTAESYAKDTALAGKFDLVLGGWELGFGGFWKYENAPKLMVTASGSVKKLSLFGEFVYQYGGAAEWLDNKEWSDKTHILQATIGGFYTWKDPGIMLAMQYFYDGNDVDLNHRIYSNGHNIALMANFNKFGSVKKLSASLFSIVNFGRAGFTDKEKESFESQKINAPKLPCFTINANFMYSFTDDIRLSMGPGIVFTDFDTNPTVSFKIGATLGGGKF